MRACAGRLVGGPYSDPMSVPARAVAAALRERIPGLAGGRLHGLLYCCQGHHLSVFGRPLFSEPIPAGEAGPVVDSLGRDPKGRLLELGEAELNTVGYVVSRYGGLAAEDLEDLVHSGEPWERGDGDGPWPGPAELARMLEGIEQRRDQPASPDSIDDIRAWLAAHG